MKRIILGATLACLATGALAQSRSSFLDIANLTGVNVVDNGGMSYTVTVDSGASFDFEGTTYEITDVFGVYALANENDLGANGSGFGGWTFSSNDAGTGGIGGWRINPGFNNGINAGEQETFTFTALNTGEFDQFGFHVRTSNGFPGGGDTGFITVPEPTTMAALAFGAALLLIRRKR